MLSPLEKALTIVLALSTLYMLVGILVDNLVLKSNEVTHTRIGLSCCSITLGIMFIVINANRDGYVFMYPMSGLFIALGLYFGLWVISDQRAKRSE